MENTKHFENRALWYKTTATTSQMVNLLRQHEACVQVVVKAERYRQLGTQESLDELHKALEARWEIYQYSKPIFDTSIQSSC